jgi:hypothetical protein
LDLVVRWFPQATKRSQFGDSVGLRGHPKKRTRLRWEDKEFADATALIRVASLKSWRGTPPRLQ